MSASSYLPDELVDEMLADNRALVSAADPSNSDPWGGLARACRSAARRDAGELFARYSPAGAAARTIRREVARLQARAFDRNGVASDEGRDAALVLQDAVLAALHNFVAAVLPRREVDEILALDRRATANLHIRAVAESRRAIPHGTTKAAQPDGKRSFCRHESH